MARSALDWVPLVEGARIIARHLSGSQSDSFNREVRADAIGRLIAALREGRLDSEGEYDDGRRRHITAAEWQSLKPDIPRNRLDPLVPNPRRIRVGDIIDIKVDAEDVREHLASIILQVEKNARSPNAKPGRPTAADWDAIELIFRAEVERRGGLPERTNEKGWRTKADAIECVKDWLVDREENAQATAVGGFVRRTLEKISSEMSEKQ